jgi:glyoxylase-like metal-dependent hydrolase (beta-lactamase superfamily II)
MNMHRLFSLAIVLTLSLGVAAQAQQPQNYAIMQVADNLYRAATSSHRTVFLVTEEGIILADPIHTEFSTWLNSELQERFGVPVRYVLYSHHHWDHASGGAVFAATATFIAHEGMAAALAAPLPSNATVLDTNGNGILERGEASGGFAANFDRLNTNGDGGLSGAEINVDIHPPDLLYSERMTVSLGGQRVELIHPNPAHSSDTTVLYFPEQRAGFAVDYINVERLPGSFDPYPFDQYVSAVGTMFALDIDIVVPGHGNVGRREHLAEYMGFLRDLQTEVSAAVAEGQTLEQAQRSVRLAEYSDWLLFDERKANVIAGAYAIVTSMP